MKDQNIESIIKDKARRLVNDLFQEEEDIWQCINKIQVFVNEFDVVLSKLNCGEGISVTYEQSKCTLEMRHLGNGLYEFYLYKKALLIENIFLQGTFKKRLIYANELSALTLPTADTLKYNAWWSPDLKSLVIGEICSVIDTYLKLTTEGEIFRGKVIEELKNELEIYWARGMISSPRKLVHEKTVWRGNGFENIPSDFPVYEPEPDTTVKYSLGLLKDFLITAITHPKEKSQEILKKIPSHVLDEIRLRIDQAFLREKLPKPLYIESGENEDAPMLDDLNFWLIENFESLEMLLSLESKRKLKESLSSIHEAFDFIASFINEGPTLDKNLYRAKKIWNEHLPDSFSLFLQLPFKDFEEGEKRRYEDKLVRQIKALENKMGRIENYIKRVKGCESIKAFSTHGRFIEDITSSIEI